MGGSVGGGGGKGESALDLFEHMVRKSTRGLWSVCCLCVEELFFHSVQDLIPLVVLINAFVWLEVAILCSFMAGENSCHPWTQFIDQQKGN